MESRIETVNKKGKVGIALLSFAHFHQYKWLETFGDDPKVEIVGFWDDDIVRARTVKRKYDIRSFSSVDEILKKKEVSAVAICSETSLHKGLVLKSCLYKKHILCEKPIAATISDALQMKDAVKKAGVIFLQSSPQRLIKGNILIKKILDSGELGRITHVRKRHGHGFSLKGLDKDMPWIVSKEKTGGGAYIDEGVHETDLLQYYFGMPQSVYAEFSKNLYGEVEKSGVAVYRYPDDLIVIHEAAWDWLAGGPTTEIYGRKGVVIESFTDCASSTGKSYWPHLSIFKKETGEWETLEDTFDFSSVHSLFPREFISILTENKDPICTIDDGVNALTMVIGAYESAKEAKTINFPLEQE
ncbi:MAG: Gfo/Idh/MocA family oxidoreductase [Spirochaetales bacterium]|nr:Gfo/Idh/MocA family oxidoreductase [Spirochaetales bacterium]